MRRRSGNPSDMPPREAMERFLDSSRLDRADETIRTYRYRLKLFVEWCEVYEIDRVGAFDGTVFDDYRRQRTGDGLAPSTLRNEMQTIKKWVEYLEEIEAVDDGLGEKVRVPRPSPDQETDETMLEPEVAQELLQGFRDHATNYGIREHAWLELAWHTGARVGGLRALDIRDYYPDGEGGPYVEFLHRPSTGTTLKNGVDGSRPVGLPETVAEVLDHYIENYRHDHRDQEGRQPLFTSQRGRPTRNTMRMWSYKATWPCWTQECPHGREPRHCDYRTHQRGSQCPSSLSPHPIRTGSITWQRDLGIPPEVVAERVNASLDVIEQHYDQASKLERLERRRRPYVNQMQIDP